MMFRSLYCRQLLAASIALCTGFVQVHAQTERPLTLDDAIQMGLKNSKQLKVSRAKIAEATAVLRQAKNNRLPDASVTAAYLRIANPTVDLKLKLGNSGGSGSGGGTGQPNTQSSIKVDQAAYALANVSMPLFSGLRIHYGIESAKYLAIAAKLDAANDREAVVQNIIDAYSNLYKAKASVDLVQENLKQSKQRVTDFTNLENNGLLARNDRLKTQLQESNVELTLLDAQNNYNISAINMDLMLGLPEDTRPVADTASFGELPDAGAADEWESDALQNRKDVMALAARQKAAEANVKSVKGLYYPGLALTGGYIAADIPNLVTITNAINAGIGLQYSISSLWKTAAKVQQAQASEREVVANEGILLDAIRVQINSAYQNYLVSLKKIQVYNAAIEQATENYTINKNKYENNLVTTTDLLEADVAQLQAKLNYAFAKADAAVAYKKLQQTAGLLDTK